MMMNTIFSLVFGMALLWSASASATGVEQPAPISPPIMLASSDGGLPVGEILHMEPAHLLTLGVGVVLGATLFGPYLGVSELLGVGIGAISSELVYRSPLWPFHKSWLQ